jgi:flagellar protein FliJ
MSNIFSLEGLLRLRRLQKDQAAAELTVTRSRAGEIAERQRATRASLTGAAGAEATSSGLSWVAAARSSTASTLAELDALEAEWQLRMEDSRQKYAAAKAAAAALEKLEERHDLAVRAEENHSEQLINDEVSGRAWHLANRKAL